MATVVLPRGLQPLAGGQERVEVQPGLIRDVIRELARRFPDLDQSLASGTAVSIDGEIIQDPFLEPVGPESEVHLLPQIGGGR